MQNTALYLIDDFEADVSIMIVNNLSGENVRYIILQIIQSWQGHLETKRWLTGSSGV